MAMTIIECPSCYHVHKKGTFCDTCKSERGWDVSHGSLTCEKCYRGWKSWNCQSCGHTIPMIEDFAKFYPDYVEFDSPSQTSAVIDHLLETQRYKTALELLELDWIGYELPAGYPLSTKQDEARKIRSRYMMLALLAGVVIGGGWVGAASEHPIGFLIGAFGGVSLAALFVYSKGGQWGEKKGQLIDGGMILFTSAVGSILIPLVIFLIIIWFWASLQSGG